MRTVLGIDAAWTEREPSGVALIADEGRGWGLVEAAASYEAFLRPASATDPVSRHSGSMPDAVALLTAACGKTGSTVDLVAVDMPLSLTPIVSRRASDDQISKAYGARHASTHTPSATRPGQLSDDLRLGFHGVGYPLAVTEPDDRALLEVYLSIGTQS